MPANPNTNTTYAAGKGLALSDNTFRLTVPRVNKSANYLPGQRTVEIEQYESTSTNIPNTAYYHIYTAEGQDTKYATQLALGMTTDGAYYRRYSNGTWGSWRSMINTDTWTAFKGATSAADGTAGYVPAPGSGWYVNRGLAFLCAQGNWRYLDEAASGVSVNNLTTTAAHRVLDARQGKALNDKINEVNTAFTNYKSTIVRSWVPSGTDLNTVQVSGFYRINANHANAPSGVDYGQLLVIQGGSDTIVQMAFPYKSTTFYIRVGNVVGNTTGSWTSWRAV